MNIETGIKNSLEQAIETGRVWLSRNTKPLELRLAYNQATGPQSGSEEGFGFLNQTSEDFKEVVRNAGGVEVEWDALLALLQTATEELGYTKTPQPSSDFERQMNNGAKEARIQWTSFQFTPPV